MQVEGACLCGTLSYVAEVDPARVFVCHCTDCQTHSGSAFRTLAMAEADTFRLTSGTLKIYEKRAESGNIRRLAFCPECGTPVYGGPAEGEPGPLSLRVGAIRQRAELRPAAQLWCRSSLTWLDGLGNVPRIETQPRAAR